MTPVEVLRAWFDAHARRELSAARALVADDVTVDVPGASLRGFDALMAWYRDRAQREGPSFGYVVEDILAGEQHAAAALTLTASGRSWRQLVLYRVDSNVITSIWAAEGNR